MRPTDVLRSEHRVIEKVLDCLEALLHRGQEGFDPDAAESLLEFLRVFADSCHHRKEEEQLFPALEARGLSVSEGPTRVMRDEHVVGRQLVETMAQHLSSWRAGDAGSYRSFGSAALDYLTLLRVHIHKEDDCLFPIAEQLLDEAAEQMVTDAFDSVEAEIQPGTHERFLDLARELCRQFGVQPPPASAAACCGHGRVPDPGGPIAR